MKSILLICIFMISLVAEARTSDGPSIGDFSKNIFSQKFYSGVEKYNQLKSPHQAEELPFENKEDIQFYQKNFKAIELPRADVLENGDVKIEVDNQEIVFNVEMAVKQQFKFNDEVYSYNFNSKLETLTYKMYRKLRPKKKVSWFNVIIETAWAEEVRVEDKILMALVNFSFEMQRELFSMYLNCTDYEKSYQDLMAKKLEGIRKQHFEKCQAQHQKLATGFAHILEEQTDLCETDSQNKKYIDFYHSLSSMLQRQKSAKPSFQSCEEWVDQEFWYVGHSKNDIGRDRSLIEARDRICQKFDRLKNCMKGKHPEWSIYDKKGLDSEKKFDQNQKIDENINKNEAK